MSCNSEQKVKGDVLVADFKGTKLYMSQLNVPFLNTKADSVRFLNTRVEEWMRTEILLAEAKKNTKSDPHVENLVNEYRKNLLVAKFEKKYVQSNLDTMVSKEEVDQFVKQHKQVINSSGPQVKFSFGKVSTNSEKIEKLDEWWKEQKMEEIRSYCTTFAEVSIFSNENWTALSELAKYVPDGVFKKDNYTKKGYYQKSYKSFEYFLYINDYQKETSELNNTEINKVKKLILHQRQKKLLKKYKDELYNSNINEKQIKFYFN